MVTSTTVTATWVLDLQVQLEVSVLGNTCSSGGVSNFHRAFNGLVRVAPQHKHPLLFDWNASYLCNKSATIPNRSAAPSDCLEDGGGAVADDADCPELVAEFLLGVYTNFSVFLPNMASLCSIFMAFNSAPSSSNRQTMWSEIAMQ
jgi:hypothetical protein